MSSNSKAEDWAKFCSLIPADKFNDQKTLYRMIFELKKEVEDLKEIIGMLQQ